MQIITIKLLILPITFANMLVSLHAFHLEAYMSLSPSENRNLLRVEDNLSSRSVEQKMGSTSVLFTGRLSIKKRGLKSFLTGFCSCYQFTRSVDSAILWSHSLQQKFSLLERFKISCGKPFRNVSALCGYLVLFPEIRSGYPRWRPAPHCN